MALFELLHHVGRDRAAKLSAAFDGQAVDHAKRNLAGLYLVGQQRFQCVLRHAGNHRADAVTAAHADNQLIQLGIINKIVLRFHIKNTLALALYHCFKFI